MGFLIYFLKKIVLLLRDMKCNNYMSAWKLVQWGNYYPNITQAVSSHSDPHPNVPYIAIQHLWVFWNFFKKIVLIPRDTQCNNYMSAWKLVNCSNYYPNIKQAVSSHSDPLPNVLYIAFPHLWGFWYFLNNACCFLVTYNAKTICLHESSASGAIIILILSKLS